MANYTFDETDEFDPKIAAEMYKQAQLSKNPDKVLTAAKIALFFRIPFATLNKISTEGYELKNGEKVVVRVFQPENEKKKFFAADIVNYLLADRIRRGRGPSGITTFVVKVPNQDVDNFRSVNAAYKMQTTKEIQMATAEAKKNGTYKPRKKKVANSESATS